MRVVLPLLLGTGLLWMGCQQLNLPAPGAAKAEEEAKKAADASAYADDQAARAKRRDAQSAPPTFPESLGLEDATWDHVLRIARAWAREGHAVPEWSAQVSLAPMFPGAARPVVFSFASEKALKAAVAPWGRPFASERNGKCHLWWFNPSAGLRADVQLETPTSAAGCSRDGETTLSLRFSPYSSLEGLLPLADGRFPFEGPTRLIGMSEAEVAQRFVAPQGGAKRLAIAPFEDAWDDATIELSYRDGVVQRFQLHSAHSPEFADAARADLAFKAAFGPSAREPETGPIWREYRKDGLVVEVGRGLNSLSLTSPACQHSDKKQLATARDAALSEWIDKQASASGAARKNYLVRAHAGPEQANVSLIERQVDACNRELWSLSWDKPDCAPTGTLVEERTFSACCDRRCKPDPRQQLFQLLAATTEGDLALVSQFLTDADAVQIAHRYPGGSWNTYLTRAELDDDKLELLPNWNRISATPEQISCAMSPAEPDLNSCTIGGSLRFEIEFKGKLLRSIASATE